MRAIVIKRYGDPDVLSIEERPDPKPQLGHVLIEVKAFGVNHAETYMREGKWPEATEISGIECAGLVKADPDGRLTPGQKVVAFMGGMGRSINGSYAELTSVPDEQCAASKDRACLGRARGDPGILRHRLDRPLWQSGSPRRSDHRHPRRHIGAGSGRGEYRHPFGRPRHRHDAQPETRRDARDPRRQGSGAGSTGPADSAYAIGTRKASMPCWSSSAIARSSARSPCSAATAASAWRASSAASIRSRPSCR